MSDGPQRGQGTGGPTGSGTSTMLPQRGARPALESAFVRAIATGGVVAIGVALGAILTSQNVAGWGCSSLCPLTVIAAPFAHAGIRKKIENTAEADAATVKCTSSAKG